MFGLHKRIEKTLIPPLVGFSLLIVLMIVLTELGLSQLREIKQHIDSIVLIHNVKTAKIETMQRANRERIISLQNMMLTDDFFEVDAEAMRNSALANQFIQARQMLESMQRAPGEAKLLLKLRASSMKAAPLNDKVRDLLWNEVEGGREEALTALRQEVRPAQDEIYSVFETLQDLYEAENRKAVYASAMAYESARKQMFWMLIATVLLSIATAAYVIRRIACNHIQLNQHKDRLEDVVTERTKELQKRSEEAVEARHDAEMANRAKSNFLANMSHDLRTPLNAVMGFSETMTCQALGPMPTVYGEYAGHINTSAKHLLDMIEQLLDLSRIEAGHMELSEEELILPDIINEVTQIVASASERPLTEFQWDKEDLNYVVKADARALRQTLINVIGNAAKFSETGTDIDITCEKREGGIALRVTDRGIGIPPNEIGQIFKPYERSSTEAARACEGTGLGLPIARSLVEAHGGSLSIASTPQVGTTVTLILPSERVSTAVYQRESAMLISA